MYIEHVYRVCGVHYGNTTGYIYLYNIITYKLIIKTIHFSFNCFKDIKIKWFYSVCQQQTNKTKWRDIVIYIYIYSYTVCV